MTNKGFKIFNELRNLIKEYRVEQHIATEILYANCKGDYDLHENRMKEIGERVGNIVDTVLEMDNNDLEDLQYIYEAIYLRYNYEQENNIQKKKIKEARNAEDTRDISIQKKKKRN